DDQGGEERGDEGELGRGDAAAAARPRRQGPRVHGPGRRGGGTCHGKPPAWHRRPWAGGAGVGLDHSLRKVYWPEMVPFRYLTKGSQVTLAEGTETTTVISSPLWAA